MHVHICIYVGHSHLGVFYGSGGIVDNTCDRVRGVLVNVSCSDWVGARYIYIAMRICVLTCSDCVV